MKARSQLTFLNNKLDKFFNGNCGCKITSFLYVVSYLYQKGYVKYDFDFTYKMIDLDLIVDYIFKLINFVDDNILLQFKQYFKSPINDYFGVDFVCPITDRLPVFLFIRQQNFVFAKNNFVDSFIFCYFHIFLPKIYYMCRNSMQ